MNDMYIVILSNGEYQFPKVGTDAFPNDGYERYIHFVDEKGKDLIGKPYRNAKAVFEEAAKNDNNPADNPNDGKWYGWSLKEPSEEPPVVTATHQVTITVQKDDNPWPDHKRTFVLSKDGTTFVTDLNAVEKAAEPYAIYDVTGLAADEYATKGMNTGVTVTVGDADVPSTDPVNYYTVTFCYVDDDGNEHTYGNETAWKPQPILKTAGRVTEPATRPTKEGHAFDKWVTVKDGDDEFNFTATPITATGMKIYAKWTKTTVPTQKVTITVQKDEKPWTDHNRTFALTKDSGATFVTDLDAVETGTYTAYDVTEVAASDFATKGMDTGVTVTVADADVPSIDPVNYYTAIFCYVDDDGNEHTYGDGTAWEPQIILKDVGRVTEPATNPTKPDHTFDKWVTTKDGDDAFNFAATPITATGTKIYAKWTEDIPTTYYTVTFYDGTTAYGADTLQSPQSVASGQKADKPADPEKPDWQFAGWKTTDGGTAAYDFDTPVTGNTNIYASWVPETAEKKLHITATATDGGTISPEGDREVTEGGEVTFEITPDEGNRIKAVTVDADTADEKDVTAELRDTQARAQTGTKYYTFSNVTKDHTIHAEFEKDGNGGGGGGDNPDPNPNPNPNPDPGGGDNSGGGSGGGGNTNPGGGNNQNPDGGNKGGGNNNGGNAGNGSGNATLGGGNSAVNGQITAGTQAGSGAAGTSAGGNAASGGSAAGSAADGAKAGGTGTATNGKEPKTGGAFRKGCAVIAIFCLLACYHIIGKNVGGNALREKHLGQAF